jgi:hypothetical protein
MLSEISQSQKSKYCMFSLLCRIYIHFLKRHESTSEIIWEEELDTQVWGEE